MRLCLLSLLLRLALGELPAPRFRVDLNVEPEHRWDHILATQKDVVAPALTHILSLPRVRPFAAVAKRLIGNELEARRIMPGTQYEEARGIARELGLDTSELIVVAAFYDIFAADQTPVGYGRACSGVVAETSTGEIIHGRNLDYMFKSDLAKITWAVDFVRGNSTVFTAVTFGPSPVFNTAVKHGSFSVSQDERDRGSWLENVFDTMVLGRHLLFGQIRQAMESLETFDQAVGFFFSSKMSAAAYFIIGGIKPGEGAVITRNRASVVDVWRLNATAGRWYVVETNYDHASAPPVGDDRRDPLIRALNSTGQTGMSATAMWRVIEVTHVNTTAGERAPLNAETIYSTVMQAGNPSTFKTVVHLGSDVPGDRMVVV